jgi:hypothetical protein
METSGIESFLKITGPWGLVAVLVFLFWDMFRKNEQSVREILLTQAAVLDNLTESLSKVDARLEGVEKKLIDLVAQLAVILRVEAGD